ncbi:hypothetical protein V8G54_023628 [Vigna mungo]|uniref:Uncharacterized protein n=1 Tax=Vigna mungo TaxID=3915 RepID=A0AAQ3RQI2_VIGMU
MPYLMHRCTLQVQNSILHRQVALLTGQCPNQVAVENYLSCLHARWRVLRYQAQARQVADKYIREIVESNLNVRVVVGCLRQVQNPCGILPPLECIFEHFGEAGFEFSRMKTVREVCLLEPPVISFGPRHILV